MLSAPIFSLSRTEAEEAAPVWRTTYFGRRKRSREVVDLWYLLVLLFTQAYGARPTFHWPKHVTWPSKGWE